MRRTIVATVLAVAGVAGAAPISAQVVPAVPYEGRTIRVSGTGEVRAQPNLATAQFGVETAAETADAAATLNAERMDRVIAALVAAGVAREDIQTSDYSVYPEYANDRRVDVEPDVPRIVGYRATNMVSLRTRDLEGIGGLIDAALAAGANRLHGVGFTLEEAAAKEAQSEALARAVADARASAETIARALGVRLGEVLDASTSPQPVVPVFSRMMVQEAAMAAAPTPIQPGQQTVYATASLVFTID